MVADTGADIPAVVEATGMFGLGVPVEDPVFAARGAMGEVYRVTTDDGRYAVKRLFEWSDGSSAEREATFTARARAAGVITAVEARTADGSLIASVRDQRFRAFSWLDLDEPLRPPLPLGVLAEMGRTVALLHQQGDPTTEVVEDWYLVPPADSSWEALAAQVDANGRRWATALAQRLPELRALSREVADAPPLPAWTCHRDLDLTNVLPLKSGGLAVLDWENLGPMPKQQEVAYVALEWAAPADDGLEARVRALRDAYAAAGGSCETLDAHSFTATWVTLLNFLVASADAALETDADVKHREFSEQAVLNILGMDLSPAAFGRVAAAWNG